ncbi:hypothetical protein AaE_007451 [Aphanomyces astaci]|uniref:DNA-directed DNA polymerase family A palm domain-containing protein n=1 Tax=Aphanomyces astaci TaxID=112090 RepID=A0A6A5AHG3_APHAT|nr:hypothetical protein AaE_007451 [Aphanomyces astaci]
MGRYRMLPDAKTESKGFSQQKAKSHAERAAINTPIQGAAADVVMRAMLNIHRDEQLRAMGWEMVCQIHDEIIMEGPADCAKEACMCTHGQLDGESVRGTAQCTFGSRRQDRVVVV